MKCQRCGNGTHTWTCSFFNTQYICMNCGIVEQQHPQYLEAVAAETAACHRGDYNFPGIGLPEDLKPKEVN